MRDQTREESCPALPTLWRYVFPDGSRSPLQVWDYVGWLRSALEKDGWDHAAIIEGLLLVAGELIYGAATHGSDREKEEIREYIAELAETCAELVQAPRPPRPDQH